LSPDRLEFYGDIASRCAGLQPASIVDIGCGTGHLLRRVLDALPHEPHVVVGVDYTRSAISVARRLVPEGTFVVADMNTVDLGQHFDLVLCTEVLEHLDKPESALASLAGMCAPGGRMLISVPDGARDDFEGHVNFWSAEEFSAFLAPAGDVALERLDDVLVASVRPPFVQIPPRAP
jgi:2-polyprenyl-3-methyl-5-hydroxy-6-metoxy-1,4-benzoquinol methylase